MGNRAVIATEKKDLGVYLHWNGGRDSVSAFLTYCKIQEFRAPEFSCYGFARLCQVIGNFFGGGGLSLGIDKYDCLDTDNWDNGTYIIKDWEIIGREFLHHGEQDEYELESTLYKIDEMQPAHMQIGKEKIKKYLEENTVSK